MDNDPKAYRQTGYKVAKDNKVNVLESQSPDVSSVENLGANLFRQEEWAQIPTNYCEKLVEGFPKCLTQVIQLKGDGTKY